MEYLQLHTLFNDAAALKKIILCHIYLLYLNKTNTVRFTILPTVEQAKFHLSSTNTGRVRLFLHVYSFLCRHALLAVHASRIGNIAK